MTKKIERCVCGAKANIMDFNCLIRINCENVAYECITAVEHKKKSTAIAMWNAAQRALKRAKKGSKK